MRTFWKCFIKEQIWFEDKTIKSNIESGGLHYSKLPPSKAYESRDFDSVCTYLESHETSCARTFLQEKPLITFLPHFSYQVTRIDRQQFKKYQHTVRYLKCTVEHYSLAKLQSELPATEFIDFLKDNFENPLDKLSNL